MSKYVKNKKREKLMLSNVQRAVENYGEYLN